MNRNSVLRASFAIVIFVIGNLQAWDSGVPQAGPLIVLLVSLAIALPPVALLVPLRRPHFMGAFALSFILITVARVISPISLPGLHLVLIPAVLALIFTGIFNQEAENTPNP
jgi:uncharacterized membrane protein YhaH (DUF805 family)